MAEEITGEEEEAEAEAVDEDEDEGTAFIAFAMRDLGGSDGTA